MAGGTQNEKQMPFWGHLEELRKRIVGSLIAVGVGFAVCFSRSEQILGLLLWPMTRKLDITAAFPFISVTPYETSQKLHYTTLTEPFWSHLKIGLISGVILAVPVLLHQLWIFISPGLLPKERQYARYFALFSSIFFAAGILFCLFVLLPFAVPFLLGYKTTQLVPILRIGEYVDFTLKFLLACGAIFELPLIIVLLSRMGILSPAWLAKNRKYALLLSFVIGAVLTPTQDVFNMTLMSVPIYLLYEIGVLAARILGRRRESGSTELQET